METINRSAIVVRPAQPFLNWLQQVDPTSAHLTLEDLQREPTIYLEAECDSQEQAIEYLGDSVNDIFEEHSTDGIACRLFGLRSEMRPRSRAGSNLPFTQ
jgi:hypothetical protein